MNKFNYKNKAFLFGMLILLFLILRIPPYFIGPDLDTGRFAADALMLNNGALMYSQVWGHKTPGMYMLFAFWFKLFGTNVYLFEFLGTLNIGLLTVIFYFLNRELFNFKTAYISTVFFIFACAYQPFSLDGLDSEYFFMLPVLLGALIMFNALKKNKTIYFFPVGVLFGFAFFIKQLAIWNAFGIGFFICILFVLYKDYKFYFKSLIYYLIGFLIIQLIWMGHFYYLGNFEQMMNCVFFSNIAYIENHPSELDLFLYVARCLGKAVIGIFIIWVLAFFQFFPNLKRLDKKENLFLFIMILVSAFAVSNSLRFYGHYFLQIIPWICILSSLLFISLYKWLLEEKNDIIRKIFSSLILLSVLFYFAIQGFYLKKYGDDNPYYKTREVASYINSVLNEKDRIYVHNLPGSIYLLTNKICPVKYVFLPAPSMLVSDPIPEVINTLKDKKPKLILKMSDSFPGGRLDKFILENYKLVKKISVVTIEGDPGDILIYRLKAVE